MTYEEFIEKIYDYTRSIEKTFGEIWEDLDIIKNQFELLKNWIILSTILTLSAIILCTLIIKKHFYKQKQEILTLRKDNLIIQKQILLLLKEKETKKIEEEQEKENE